MDSSLTSYWGIPPPSESDMMAESGRRRGGGQQWGEHAGGGVGVGRRWVAGWLGDLVRQSAPSMRY